MCPSELLKCAFDLQGRFRSQVSNPHIIVILMIIIIMIIMIIIIIIILMIS